MCCLYFVAAFWKLTTSFLDSHLVRLLAFAELASTLVPETMLPSAAPQALLRAAPTLSALLGLPSSQHRGHAPHGIILSIGST